MYWSLAPSVYRTPYTREGEHAIPGQGEDGPRARLHTDHAGGVLHEYCEDHHGESAAFPQVATVDERDRKTGGGFEQTGDVCTHTEY